MGRDSQIRNFQFPGSLPSVCTEKRLRKIIGIYMYIYTIFKSGYDHTYCLPSDYHDEINCSALTDYYCRESYCQISRELLLLLRIQYDMVLLSTRLNNNNITALLLLLHSCYTTGWPSGASFFKQAYTLPLPTQPKKNVSVCVPPRPRGGNQIMMLPPHRISYTQVYHTYIPIPIPIPMPMIDRQIDRQIDRYLLLTYLTLSSPIPYVRTY